MGYLLDTCVLSEFTKPRPSALLERWLADIPDASQFVSVLTIGELEKSVRKLAASRRRVALERWLVEIGARLADRVLAVDTEVAIEWGKISARVETKGRPMPVIDALIGATALVHGHTVVTRNTSDIARSGAAMLDPWKT